MRTSADSCATSQREKCCWLAKSLLKVHTPNIDGGSGTVTAWVTGSKLGFLKAATPENKDPDLSNMPSCCHDLPEVLSKTKATSLPHSPMIALVTRNHPLPGGDVFLSQLENERQWKSVLRSPLLPGLFILHCHLQEQVFFLCWKERQDLALITVVYIILSLRTGTLFTGLMLQKGTIIPVWLSSCFFEKSPRSLLWGSLLPLPSRPQSNKLFLESAYAPKINWIHPTSHVSHINPIRASPLVLPA